MGTTLGRIICWDPIDSLSEPLTSSTPTSYKPVTWNLLAVPSDLSLFQGLVRELHLESTVFVVNQHNWVIKPKTKIIVTYRVEARYEPENIQRNMHIWREQAARVDAVCKFFIYTPKKVINREEVRKLFNNAFLFIIQQQFSSTITENFEVIDNDSEKRRFLDYVTGNE